MTSEALPASEGTGVGDQQQAAGDSAGMPRSVSEAPAARELSASTDATDSVGGAPSTASKVRTRGAASC